MHYLLTTNSGTRFDFYVLLCAEIYQSAYGGEITTTKDKFKDYNGNF